MPPNRKNRPDITSITSGAGLHRWYWLKPELEARAKALGVRATGGKFTILERLAHFLDTGETIWPGDTHAKTHSKFDWHSADLTPETVITDSYRNSQNVRRFFKKHAEEKFKFNIAFEAEYGQDPCRCGCGLPTPAARSLSTRSAKRDRASQSVQSIHP